MEWVLLGSSLLVILGGAELFTNGVEWIGEGFGLSEGVVGSVLAAVGTALPETILPLVAILSGHAGGEEIGIGAILGAPFLHYALAVVLVVGYVFYVRRHLRAPGERELEDEARNEIHPLYLWGWLRWVRRSLAPWSGASPDWPMFVQTGISLLLIIGGARMFVSGVNTLAENFGVSHLVFALLVAPVATELPEKFNSVLWVRRGKDTLALGNMTGAMVFQSSFPVTIGLLLTPWYLAHEALVAAVIALVAGGVLWLTIRFRGRFSAPLLLLQGVFFAGYVAYVVTR